MKKILLVCHRYAPYPGGTEYYVQNIAEELLNRRYDVTVLADTHQGDYNGVKLSSDYQILLEKWDLIIVHGADVRTQDVVHQNSEIISNNSPILYLIVKPSASLNALIGMENADFLGCSTSFDTGHVVEYLRSTDKIRKIRHGIPIEKSIKQKTVKSSSFIHFTSVGGFWHHKGFRELSEVFVELAEYHPNIWLHLYGYSGPQELILEHPRIDVVSGAKHNAVLQAISNADVYIMNSYEEGFGLVLLEAMVNKVPWFARDIAGAHDLKEFGHTYKSRDELKSLMDTYIRVRNTGEDISKEFNVDYAFDYVVNNHSIVNTVDDIEKVINED